MSIVAKRPAVKKGNIITPVKITTKKIETFKSDNYDLNGEEGSINNIIELLNDYVDGDETLDLELNGSTVFSTEINQLPHCCGIYELPNCCGIYELGGISFNTFKDEIKFFNALAICRTGKTLMINTINTGQTATLAAVLAKCSNWTLVKTFVNIGSRNTIKIWMSNNN